MGLQGCVCVCVCVAGKGGKRTGPFPESEFKTLTQTVSKNAAYMSRPCAIATSIKVISDTVMRIC